MQQMSDLSMNHYDIIELEHNTMLLLWFKVCYVFYGILLSPVMVCVLKKTSPSPTATRSFSSISSIMTSKYTKKLSKCTGTFVISEVCAFS